MATELGMEYMTLSKSQAHFVENWVDDAVADLRQSGVDHFHTDQLFEYNSDSRLRHLELGLQCLVFGQRMIDTTPDIFVSLSVRLIDGHSIFDGIPTTSNAIAAQMDAYEPPAIYLVNKDIRCTKRAYLEKYLLPISLDNIAAPDNVFAHFAAYRAHTPNNRDVLYQRFIEAEVQKSGG